MDLTDRPRRLTPGRILGPASRRLGGAAVATLLTATAVVACAASDDAPAGGSGSSGSSELSAVGDPGGGDGAVADRATDQAEAPEAAGGSTAKQVAERARAVIATGTVSLRSDDVAQARFDVQRVVDEQGGEIADEETGTDDEGEVRRSRLVLRVPVDAFDQVMAEVAEVAELSRATRTTDDVTTQVIDNESRVRAQRTSLERVEALLARAEDLEDIVAIETQLTRRQAELDSLEQQQAWLADQTSLATVTVLVERATQPADDVDRAGFLIGLGDGWDALQRSTVAVLTTLGAVLPFALLLALLALPGRLLLRRLADRSAARRSARTPSAAPAAPGPSTG